MFLGKIRVQSGLMQHYLRHTLFYDLVVGRAYIRVVSDEQKVLQNAQEERFGRRVHRGVLQNFKAILHIVDVHSDVVETRMELVRVFFLAFYEDLVVPLHVRVGFVLESLWENTLLKMLGQFELWEVLVT